MGSRYRSSSRMGGGKLAPSPGGFRGGGPLRTTLLGPSSLRATDMIALPQERIAKINFRKISAPTLCICRGTSRPSLAPALVKWLCHWILLVFTECRQTADAKFPVLSKNANSNRADALILVEGLVSRRIDFPKEIQDAPKREKVIRPGGPN